MFLPLWLAAGLRAAERPPLLSPTEALAKFQLEPGLRIELVAAEPLISDPVAFAFDEQHRLYVVEGRGYPDPLDGKPKPPVARIALLEDTDGDGRYDRRKEFAQDLTYPNGIMPWRGGVFVTCAPDIFYLKDTDGDGIADLRRVVLTGFDTSKTTQLRVSHPTLGLDGKIYVTSGLTGGKVTSPEHPERAAVTFTPADGRFDPETLVYERTGGRGQFGLTMDDFGRRFVCSNRHPVLQVVLEPWQLRRNPHLAFSETTQEVSKVEANAKVFPISHAYITADFMPSLMGKPHAGTFTSACSVHVFGGDALTPDHVGNVFICEPAQNLVQRQVLRAEGATFRSDPPYTGKEFLSSTDVWFRPVFAAEGPDGALYLADMHRREIDHPQYVPEEARGGLDFESGKGVGRIYRIVREGGDGPPTRKRMDGTPVPTTQLVRDLEAPGAWSRAQAQRLLLERNDAAAVPLLERTVTAAALPAARSRALWILRDLKKLNPATVAAALRDPAADVREQAVALAGENLSASAELAEKLLATGDDADPRVRFAAALAFGSWGDARAVAALAKIAVRDGADRWTRAAVLSGIGARMPEFLAAVMATGAQQTPAFGAVMEEFGRTFGAGAPLDACRHFVGEMLAGEGPLGWRLPALLGLAEGLRGRTELKSAGAGSPFAALFAREAAGSAPAPLAGLFLRATALASNEQAPTADRVRAAALLGYADFERVGQALGGLLGPRHAPEIQLQAVRSLDRLGDPRGADLLVQPENWVRATPQLREAIIGALTSKPKMIEAMFAAIRRGALKATDISSVRRTQLLKHNDATIRAAAEAVFQDFEQGDRMKVYRAHRDLLKQPGEAHAGAAVFTRVCSACHTFDGVGGKVGPDLSGVRHQPADALLLHILVPNYEVVPAYQAISVTTEDGRALSGWMSGETETSLTLRTAAGGEETVLRKNVASVSASGASLMPDGLEQAMTKDELVSLIAYLKSERPL
ncbi:MAG TPA: PVC-type heme-binding CxxCH protein [Opitutaceae bacterium]|nr:PVC-type heme-binding CxxCH protein [Opitutaceae bacterium]